MDPDLLSLLPKINFNRRDFVVTTLATGFALAVQPISAQTITTDTTGIEAGEVKIPTPDGQMPAYRAAPAKGESFPVVLVVQEIFGVHEHIKDLCRRLAKAGYLAVAPELYARQGDVSKITDFKKIIDDVVSKVPDKQVMADLDATVEWAKKSGKGDTSKLAITGFCWGGRIVWLYSTHNPNLKAGAAWYGRLVGVADPLHPKHPVDIAADVKAPVLGLYGELDKGISVESVDKMRDALKTAGNKTSDIIVFPGAEHGFNADYRPSYNKATAEDAWKKMLEWFKKNGVAP
jgi:carboxymethylenebutenolidase